VYVCLCKGNISCAVRAGMAYCKEALGLPTERGGGGHKKRVRNAEKRGGYIKSMRGGGGFKKLSI